MRTTHACGCAMVAVVITSSVVGFVVAPVRADVHLEWRPNSFFAQTGDPVNLGLWVVSNSDTEISHAEIIFSWPPALLELDGLTSTGAAPTHFAGFMTPGCGLNESIPPSDGDGMFTWLASPDHPVYATASGTLLTTFKFEAKVGTSLLPAEVKLLHSIEQEDETCTSLIADGLGPNILGSVDDANITILCGNDEDCNDGNPCVASYACQGVTCVRPHVANGTSCSDDVFCNGSEVCEDGTCVSAVPPCPENTQCNEQLEECVACPPFGDFDRDCDVDVSDCAIFADCLNGPNMLPAPAGVPSVLDCLGVFDVDRDNDVDLADFCYVELAVQKCPPRGDLDGDCDVDWDDFADAITCFSGPNATPNPQAPLSTADCLAVFDVDQDADVDVFDIARLHVLFGT